MGSLLVAMTERDGMTQQHVDKVESVLGLIAADEDNNDMDAWEIYGFARRLLIALGKEAKDAPAEINGCLEYLDSLMTEVPTEQ